MAASMPRAYRAPCPHCGAPVEFASAASASAVCSYCRSTLVRDGEALRRIGASAELFDDHSPLQLGAAGSYRGVAFTLVGRLQYGYSSGVPAADPAMAAPAELDGTWNEWHALFDNGRSGWLSEDNGAYVFAFDAAAPPEAPSAGQLRAGAPLRLDGRAWTVASVVRARLLAAQGELPQPPHLQGEFVVADLRNADEEVATLDYADPGRPLWSIGRAVLLAELRMTGLRETSEKTLGARAFACPSCGQALELRLDTTQSVSCSACQAVVDVSQGVGGELAHYAQANSGPGGLEPQIPLGSIGHLALGSAKPEDWQVVGFLERCDLPAPGSSDEQVFWREYLLYHRTLGFAFLVDAEDGWSWVRPLTGTPGAERGSRITWRGAAYRRRYAYAAKVTWVQGEFYWRVRRDERAEVIDYDGVGAAARRRLSYEKVGEEITWSAGEAMSAQQVAAAFPTLPPEQAALLRDAAPLALDARRPGSGIGKGLLILLVFIVLVLVVVTCSDRSGCDDERRTFGESSAEYRQCLNNRSSGSSSHTSGGSFGGYSSGGGHK